MRIKDVLQKTTQFFRDKGFETARLDTELLIASALKWERVKLYMNYEYPLTDLELTTCRELVRRRATGEPIAYILGSKDFYKHSFRVSPAVLIPRPETETLVEEAVLWLKKERGEKPLRFIDLGTGSGCIGLSMLSELQDSHLLGIDISAAAIEVAMDNAESLGLNDRAHFFAADAKEFVVSKAMEILKGEADAVVANPPYIASEDTNVHENVRKFEPAIALFSGQDGLEHLRSWTAKAAELVRAGGLVMFEIGAEQGRVAREIFTATGQYSEVKVMTDLSGRERFVRAIRHCAN